MKTALKSGFEGMVWIICCALASCTASRQAFDPGRKYPPAKLQADYKIFRGILESAHPSLYWYTPKDSMDYYFNEGYSRLKDSMTEDQFRMDLSYVISKINCGHTSVKASKAYIRYADTAEEKTFPFILKFWGDSMVVTANLRLQDREFKRGTILKSINGYDAHQLTDTLFNFVTTDGYSLSGKYQTLSTGFTFANLYKHVMGFADSVDISYVDSLGRERQAYVPLYDFRSDTLRKRLQAE
ncbi:MAG TPA: peptidase S41, partial [Puia sp.]